MLIRISGTIIRRHAEIHVTIGLLSQSNLIAFDNWIVLCYSAPVCGMS